jgi:hypothetical protein
VRSAGAASTAARSASVTWHPCDQAAPLPLTLPSFALGPFPSPWERGTALFTLSPWERDGVRVFCGSPLSPWERDG